MQRSKRYAIVVFVLMLVSALMVTSALAARDPFVGAWESIDIVDGSFQTMSIGGGPGDRHRVRFLDYGASICDDPPFSGALDYAASAQGWLNHSSDYVIAGDLQVYCLSRPAVLWGSANFTLTYDPLTDTITDGFGVIWSRR